MKTKKLIRTERTINGYKKSKGKYLSDPVIEINIDKIPLDVLQKIVEANPADPLLYDAYELTEQQLTKLYSLLEKQITSGFKKFEYYLECYGIYE